MSLVTLMWSGLKADRTMKEHSASSDLLTSGLFPPPPFVSLFRDLRFNTSEELLDLF
jgi:hypothetical protein